MTPAERTKFLAQRKTGLGGSDMGIVMRVSHYKSRFRLWQEKRGLIEPDKIEEQENIIWGNALEPVIADEFARRNGCKLRRHAGKRHAEHTWMLAHPDRLIVGEEKGLEVKNADKYAQEWGEGPEDIPASYYLQVQHYMIAYSVQSWYVAALQGGNKYRQYEIQRAPKLCDAIIRDGNEFWKLCQGDVPPILEDIEDAPLYYKTSDTEATATAEIYAVWQDYVAHDEMLKDCEKAIKEYKLKLLDYMMGSQRLAYNGTLLATNKPYAKKSFKQKDLERDLPEIAARYIGEIQVSPFLIKRPKGDTVE